MVSNLLAMASNLRAMASNQLIAMASNLLATTVCCLILTSIDSPLIDAFEVINPPFYFRKDTPEKQRSEKLAQLR